MAAPLRARVYIDGFNLFYGILRGGHGRRWLDLRRLGERLVPPGYELDQVRYFTARVLPRDGDDGPCRRQDLYLRALSGSEGVTVHQGRMRTRPQWMVVVDPQPDDPPWERGLHGPARSRADRGLPEGLWVEHTEEKGTDVGIATWILLDCIEEGIDLVVLVSDDSDLAEPLRIVRARGVRAIVVSPQQQHAEVLGTDPRDWGRLTIPMVESCQLPERVQDASGEDVHRPNVW